MNSRTLGTWTTPLMAYALMACNVEEQGVQLPISSSEAALTATDNSERALTGLLDAVQFLDDSDAFAQVLGGFDDSSSEADCGAPVPYCEADNDSCQNPPPEFDCHSSPEGDSEADIQQMREGMEELMRQLRNRVFTEENLESATDTSVTYLLGPDLLCGGGDDTSQPSADPGPNLPPGSEDQYPEDDFSGPDDCEERARFVQPRLRLTSPSEGDIDVTLLVGEARHEPMQLQMHSNSLGWQMDLGQSVAFLRDLGEAPDDIDSISGVVQVRLVENGAADYSVELNILEDVEVSTHTELGEPVSVSLSRSAPALQVNANGNSKTLQLLQDWGTFELLAPLDALAGSMSEGDEFGGYPDDRLTAGPNGEQPNDADFDAPAQDDNFSSEPEHNYTGVIELLVAGLSSTVTYTADTEEISVSNLGFGNARSTLKHDGRLLAGFDFNEDSSRRVDLLLRALQQEGVEIEFNPSLRAQFEFAFHHIADQLEEVPNFLMEDTLGISLSGDTPTLQLVQEQVVVSSGTLELTSSAVPESNLTVAAGQCLLESEQEQAGGHELLSSLSAGVCQ